MALPWMTGGVAGVDEEERKLPFAIPSRKQVFGEEEDASQAPRSPAPAAPTTESPTSLPFAMPSREEIFGAAEREPVEPVAQAPVDPEQPFAKLESFNNTRMANRGILPIGGQEGNAPPPIAPIEPTPKNIYDEQGFWAATKAQAIRGVEEMQSSKRIGRAAAGIDPNNLGTVAEIPAGMSAIAAGSKAIATEKMVDRLSPDQKRTLDVEVEKKLKEEARNAANPIIDPNSGFLKRGWFSAVGSVAGMLNNMVAGLDEAAIGAGTAAAGAAAIGGAITAPAGGIGAIPSAVVAAPVGWTAGMTAGTAKEWYFQGLGDSYVDMVKAGIDKTAAQNVASVMAAPYAAIEFMFNKIPGLGKVFDIGAAHTAKVAARGGFMNALKAATLSTVYNTPGEMGEEAGQSMVQDWAYNLANKISAANGGDKAAMKDTEEIFSNAWENFKESAIPSLVMIGGGNVASLPSTIQKKPMAQADFIKAKPAAVAAMSASGVRPEIVERARKAQTYQAYQATINENYADIVADMAVANGFQGVSDKQAADLLARMRAKYPEHRQTQVVGSQDPRDTVRAIVEIQRGLAPGALRRPTATMRPAKAAQPKVDPAAGVTYGSAEDQSRNEELVQTPEQFEAEIDRIMAGFDAQEAPAADALKAAIEDPEGLIAAIQAEIDAKIAQEASGDQDAPTPAPIVPDAPTGLETPLEGALPAVPPTATPATAPESLQARPTAAQPFVQAPPAGQPTGQPAAQPPPLSAPQAHAVSGTPSGPAPMPASPAAPAGQAVRPPPGTPPADRGAAPISKERAEADRIMANDPEKYRFQDDITPSEINWIWSEAQTIQDERKEANAPERSQIQKELASLKGKRKGPDAQRKKDIKDRLEELDALEAEPMARAEAAYAVAQEELAQRIIAKAKAAGIDVSKIDEDAMYDEISNLSDGRMNEYGWNKPLVDQGVELIREMAGEQQPKAKPAAKPPELMTPEEMGQVVLFHGNRAGIEVGSKLKIPLSLSENKSDLRGHVKAAYLSDQSGVALAYAGSGKVSTWRAVPGAKILVEGTREFSSIAEKATGSKLERASFVANYANNNGYDGVWFKDTAQLGVLVFNADAFERVGNEGAGYVRQGDRYVYLPASPAVPEGATAPQPEPSDAQAARGPAAEAGIPAKRPNAAAVRKMTRKQAVALAAAEGVMGPNEVAGDPWVGYTAKDVQDRILKARKAKEQPELKNARDAGVQEQKGSSQKEENTQKQLTTVLRNGMEVTAKIYNGKLSAITYANRTQANAARDKMQDPDKWDVYHFGRPFYIGRSESVAATPSGVQEPEGGLPQKETEQPRGMRAEELRKGRFVGDGTGFVGPFVRIEGNSAVVLSEGEAGMSDQVLIPLDRVQPEDDFQMSPADLAKTYPDEFGQERGQPEKAPAEAQRPQAAPTDTTATEGKPAPQQEPSEAKAERGLATIDSKENRTRLPGETFEQWLNRLSGKPADWKPSKADKLRKKADALAKEAHHMLDRIPAGQPIHSTRDRNLRERSAEKMRKASEYRQQAEEIEKSEKAAKENAGSSKMEQTDFSPLRKGQLVRYKGQEYFVSGMPRLLKKQGIVEITSKGGGEAKAVRAELLERIPDTGDGGHGSPEARDQRPKVRRAGEQAEQPVVTDTPDGVKVEVPMSPKAEAKVTPKEQKKYFIDQIDAAIDAATDLVPTRKDRKDATPTALGSAAEDFLANAEEIGTVEIEVPGDGTFTLLNTKDALRKLKARAAAMFPATPPTASAPSKPSGKPSAIAKVGPRPGAAVKPAWDKLLEPFTIKDKNPTPKRAQMVTPLFSPAKNETVATDSRRLVVALGVKIGAPIQEGGLQYSYVVPGYRQNQLPKKQNDQQTVRVADTEKFIRQIRQAKMATEERKAGWDTIGLYAMPDGSVAVASMYSGDGYVSQDVSKGTMIGAFTADFVDEIVTFLRKTGNQAIEIRHRDEDSPLVLLGAKEYAVLMPVRGTELNAPDALAGMVPREAPAAKPQARKDAPPPPAPESPAARAGELQDFGEKIGGARKDMVPSAAKEIADGDLAQMSFSQIWPKAEVDAIEDADMAALATALRNSIPAKPRKGYKVNRWVESVKTVRTLMQLANERGVADIVDRMRTPEYRLLGGLADKVDLLRQLPRNQWDRIGKVENYPDSYRYEQAKAGEAGADKHTSLSGEEKWYKRVPSPHATAEVDGRIVSADNLDALPTAVAERLGVPPEASAMQFEIRGRVGSSVRINKKGDPLYRPLKEFTGETAVEQARAFIENSRDDLVAAWEAIKESDNVKESDVRRDANRPRTAKDYRQGRDVTPEMFSEAFGFRGVEFGNWVAQGANRKERQGMLNEAFDAFSDLADIIGVPSRALSLNGELAMAFGARGSGKFAAHYEPGKIVINLTKTRGAGSLAHEFFHALDHYFQRKRGETGVSRDRNFITYNPETYYQDKASGVRLPARRFNELLAKGRLNKASDWTRIEGVRPEVEEAFSALVKALDESPMHKRASLIDKGKSGGYWSRIIERAARSFENYVIHKMAQKGYQNDYLANVASIEEFQRDAGRYPYLLAEELKPIEQTFDDLFGTIKTRETDKGVAMYAAKLDGPATSLGEKLESTAKNQYDRSDGVDSSEYLFQDGTGIAVNDDHRIINTAFGNRGIPSGYYNEPGSSAGYMIAFMGETGAIRTRLSSDGNLQLSFVRQPTREQIRAILNTSAGTVVVDRYSKKYATLASKEFSMPYEAEELQSFLQSGGSTTRFAAQNQLAPGPQQSIGENYGTEPTAGMAGREDGGQLPAGAAAGYAGRDALPFGDRDGRQGALPGQEPGGVQAPARLGREIAASEETASEIARRRTGGYAANFAEAEPAPEYADTPEAQDAAAMLKAHGVERVHVVRGMKSLAVRMPDGSVFLDESLGTGAAGTSLHELVHKWKREANPEVVRLVNAFQRSTAAAKRFVARLADSVESALGNRADAEAYANEHAAEEAGAIMLDLATEGGGRSALGLARADVLAAYGGLAVQAEKLALGLSDKAQAAKRAYLDGKAAQAAPEAAATDSTARQDAGMQGLDEQALLRAGYEIVKRDASNISGSEYFTLAPVTKWEDGEPAAYGDDIRVRISDHPARPTYERIHGTAAYDIGPHEMANAKTVAEFMQKLARRNDGHKPMPADAATTIKKSKDADRILRSLDIGSIHDGEAIPAETLEQMRNLRGVNPSLDDVLVRYDQMHGVQYPTAETDRAYLSAVEAGDTATAQRIVDEAAIKKIENAVQVAKRELSAQSAQNDFIPVEWVVEDRPEENQKLWFPEPDLPEHLSSLDEFVPKYAIEEIDGKYILDEDLTEYNSLENAKSAYESKLRKWAEEVDTSGSFGQSMSGHSVSSNIFDAFPDHPAIKEGWGDTKWGSWYLQFRDQDGAIRKISVRDHDASRKDMGIPDKIFYVEKSWTPDDVGAALIRAWKYIQDNSADPIVRDDTGRIIPPSERFNPQSEDIRYAAAWHGSPHTFDKFSMDKIGTGEGAQSYGHGLYFAGAKEVAEHYRDTLSDPVDYGITIRGKPADNYIPANELEAEVIEEIKKTQAAPEIIDVDLDDLKRTIIANLKNGLMFDPDYSDYTKAEINAALNVVNDIRVITEDSGRLYRVDLKPAEDEYLLWDKPLSEQSEKVKKAILNSWRKSPVGKITQTKDRGGGVAWEYNGSVYSNKSSAIAAQKSAESFQNNPTGQAIYDQLVSRFSTAADASKYLHDLGIPGIKYLDQGSRASSDWSVAQVGGKWYAENYSLGQNEEFKTEAEAKEFVDGKSGTYNYVLFDDSLVTVEAMYASKPPPSTPASSEWDGATVEEYSTKSGAVRFKVTVNGKSRQAGFGSAENAERYLTEQKARLEEDHAAIVRRTKASVADIAETRRKLTIELSNEKAVAADVVNSLFKAMTRLDIMTPVHRKEIAAEIKRTAQERKADPDGWAKRTTDKVWQIASRISYMKELGEIFDKKQPIVTENKTLQAKPKYDAFVNQWIAKAKEYAELTPEEVNRRLEAIDADQANRLANRGEDMAEEIDESVRERHLLSTFGGLYHGADYAKAKAAFEAAKDLVTEGRERFMEMENHRKLQAAASRQQIIEETKGGRQIDGGELEMETRSKSIWELLSAAGNWLHSKTLSGPYLYNQAADTRKGVADMSGEAVRQYEGEVRAIENEEQLGETVREDLTGIMADAMGLADPAKDRKEAAKFSKILHGWRQKQKATGIFLHRAVRNSHGDIVRIEQGSELRNSQTKLLTMFLIAKRAESAAKQRFTNEPVEIEGGFNSIMEALVHNGYTAETVAQIEKNLDQRLIKIGWKMLEYMRDHSRPEVEKATFRLLGAVPPMYGDWYFPMDRANDKRNVAGGRNAYTLVHGFMKMLTPNKLDFRPVDAFERFLSHFDDLNHVVSHIEIVDQQNRIFNHPDMQKALRVYRGDSMRRAVNNHLDRLTLGGEAGMADSALRWFRSMFARSVIPNPTQTPKQMSSMILFSTRELPPGASIMDWFTGFGKAIASPRDALRFNDDLNKYSVRWRERYGHGYNQQVREARRGATARDLLGKKMAWFEFMNAFPQAGDKMSSLIGGRPIYDLWYKHYTEVEKNPPIAAREKAMRKFMDAVELTQQSGALPHLSDSQVGFAANFMMFKTQPTAMTRLWMNSARNLAMKRGTVRDNVWNMVAVMIGQMAFQAAADAFFVAAFDDPDEWKRLRHNQVRAALFAPINGYLVLPEALLRLTKILMKDKVYGEFAGDVSSYLDVVNDIENVVKMFMKEEEMDGNDWMDVAQGIGSIGGAFTGKPIAPTVRWGRGIYDATTDPTLSTPGRIARGVGYGKQAAGQDKPRKTSASSSPYPWAQPAYKSPWER